MGFKITDAWLRANHGKPYSGKPEITYKAGVGLRISPKGKFTWVYRFLLDGKAVKMKIGEYPAQKIKDALEVRNELHELIQQGIDPRNKKLIRLGENRPQTMAALINYYVDNKLKETNVQWETIARSLERSVVPYIGDYDVNALEIADYVELFRKERERAGAKHAGRLLHRLKTVLNFAVRNGFIKYNTLAVLTAKDVGEPSRPRTVKLVGVEIGAYWTYIQSLPYHETMVNMLMLSFIFANRISELRLAKKEHFDFDKMIWTVPKENNKIRDKGGDRIKRPIPELAGQILRRQFALTPDKEYVFPRYYRSCVDLPVNHKTPYRPCVVLKEAMEKEGFTGTTIHDMRRTARNAWEMMKFPFHVSETMLGHKVHRGTHAHYLDYDYLPEQLECYERWCDYLLEQAELYQSQTKQVIEVKKFGKRTPKRNDQVIEPSPVVSLVG